MDSEENETATLVSRLKRLWERKLVQWAAAYAAGSWLLIQIIDTVGPRWGVPDALSRALDVVLILGFFAVLIIAWYHGEKGRQRVSGPELLMLAVLLLIGRLALHMLNREQTVEQTVSAPAEVASDVVEAAAPNPLQSIAVLPFDNYSPDPDDAYFAAGITEEITSQLSGIADLTVLSRVAVERAMESSDSLEEIARKIRAGSVLEGSVRMAGNRVRITAQLIDMSNGQHLWSQSFDRDLDDIFEIQTSVALAIGDALRAQLTNSERQRIEKPLTENVRSYQLYLKQTELWGSLPEQNAEGIRILEQALELDPNFATALARLAWRHNWKYWTSGDTSSAALAMSLARQSLSMDSDLPIAHFALASALISENRFEEALESYDRTLQFDPNFSAALSDSSIWHGLAGDLEISLRRAFRGVQLNPNSSIYRWHAVVPLILIGDHARAAAWLELAKAEDMASGRLELARVQLDMSQGNIEAASSRAKLIIGKYGDEPESLQWATVLLFMMGQWQEVHATLEQLGREAPNVTLGMLLPRRNQTLLGFVLAEAGQREDAARVFENCLETQLATERQDREFYIDLASIHAYQGRHDEAMDALEKAFSGGLLSDFILRTDPMFASMRTEARFNGLLERMAAQKRELRRRAEQAGAFEGYDQLIAAGPIEPKH